MGGPSRRLTALRWPSRGPYHLLNVRVPVCVLRTCEPVQADSEGCANLDLTIGRDGQIEVISPRGAQPTHYVLVQGQGRQVWPGFVDLHAHLDNTATWDRAPNHEGTFEGALAASGEARKQPWSLHDVHTRMSEAIAEAYAMGTVAIRTHIDSAPERAKISWQAFPKVQRDWQGKVHLHGVVLFPGSLATSPLAHELGQAAARHGAALGPVIRLGADREVQIRRSFELAEQFGLDLDIHVDETGQLDADGLGHIARIALDRKFRGRIICGHACSLSLHDETSANATIAALSKARIGIVSLPATNLYLQGRKTGHTPTWRGITRLHELRAAGVPVAIAGDNRQDAFYPFGDYDMVDVFRDAVRIAHLDVPMAGWVDAVSCTPAQMMGLQHAGSIGPGAPADFIAFPARTAAEVLASRGRDRQVVRQGRALSVPKRA